MDTKIIVLCLCTCIWIRDISCSGLSLERSKRADDPNALENTVQNLANELTALKAQVTQLQNQLSKFVAIEVFFFSKYINHI